MEKEVMKKLNEFVLNFEKDCEKNKIGDSNDNIFNILKVETAEIRHSNFLEWLLDCNAGHKLGNKILNAFLDKLNSKDENIEKIKDFPFWTQGIEEYTVEREKDHTDILIVSKERKFVICIENKTESMEHNTGKGNKKQTYDYREHILENYKSEEGYHHLFIYLSAKGEIPADEKNWIVTNYKVLSEVLEDILKENKVDDGIYYLIKWYIDILKRDGYAEDEKFAYNCQALYDTYNNAWNIIEKDKNTYNKLYEKYKNSWNIITQNSKSYIDELKAEVNKRLRNYENEGKITILNLDKEKEDYAEIFFYTSSMKENFNTEKISWDIYVNNKYVRIGLWTEHYSGMKENEVENIRNVWKEKITDNLTNKDRSNAILSDINNGDKTKILKTLDKIIEYDWGKCDNDFYKLKKSIEED